MDDEIRAVIGPALTAMMDEAEPANTAALFAGLTAFVGLVGQNWTAAGRKEFIDLAVGELDDLPGGLVIDALARARRRVTDGRLLVAWICDDVEPKAAKLEAEMEMVAKLASLL